MIVDKTQERAEAVVDGICQLVEARRQFVAEPVRVIYP